MKIKYVYLVLFFLGTLLPLSQFWGFLVEHRMNFKLFLEQLFANKISSFFAMDVLVSAVVTTVLIIYEARRNKIKHYWVSLIALYFAGVSSGLPLFLFLLKRQTEKGM